MKTLVGIQNLVGNELVVPDLPLSDASNASNGTNESNGIWTPQTFEAFCLANPGIHCELDPQGKIHLMPPTNSNTGNKNLGISAQIYIWLKQNPDFIGFDSSTGFTFPNQAVRSPDTSVLRRADWDALTPEDKNRFAPAVPLFLIEIRSSSSDDLTATQQKMDEYIGCGVQLAWFIDPMNETLHVYQPDAPPTLHPAPATFSADPILPGFILDFEDIWTNN